MGNGIDSEERGERDRGCERRGRGRDGEGERRGRERERERESQV